MRAVPELTLLLWRSCREATDEVPLVTALSLSTRSAFRVALALRSGLHGMTGVRFELVARDLIRPFGAPSPEGKGKTF